MTEQNNGGQPAVESSKDYVLASEQEAAEQKPVETAGEPDKTDTQDDQPKPKKLGGYQRRIQNLSAENQRLAQELEQLRQAQNPQKAQTPEKQPAAAQVKADGEPDMNDFENVLDYLKAHQKWESAQAIKSFKETETKTAMEQKAAQEYQEKQAAFDERLEAIVDKVPDFYERAADLYRQGLVTPEMERAVLDSPVGEMVTLYYMAHPHEMQELVGKSEAQVYRAVALVEAKLVGVQQPVVGKQTRAAAPINPVKSSTGTQRSLTDDLPYDEWKKLRNDGLRR